MKQHSRQNHRFVRRRSAQGALPGSRFGALVGLFERVTLVPHAGVRPDDNHLYVWLRVPQGRFAGEYECAVNIHSRKRTHVQFALLEEDLRGAALPPPGFWEEALAYADLGVEQSDFLSATEGKLQSLVSHYAVTCSRVAAFGITYPEGDGLHDVHLNCGEDPGSGHVDRRGEDGALVFYFESGVRAPYAVWLLLKFEAQRLPVPDEVGRIG